MRKPKNSLELPNPTRNTRKFANKLLTDTSGEIDLQSKQHIICHLAKVGPATSAHYVPDVIPFSVRDISHTIKKKKKNNIRNIFRPRMFQQVGRFTSCVIQCLAERKFGRAINYQACYRCTLVPRLPLHIPRYQF